MAQQSSVPVPEDRKDLDGSDDLFQLHEISSLLIQEGNLDALYNRILDAAMSMMSSAMASMQLLDPERDQLRLNRVAGISSAISLLLAIGFSRFHQRLCVGIVRRVPRGGGRH